MRISQDNTDLGRSCAFLCEFADLINDLLRGSFEPRWWSARVWYGAGRYAFAIAVHATHVCDVGERLKCKYGLVRKDVGILRVEVGGKH